MTFTVRVRTAAEHDVAGAQDWYEEQLFGLGSAFHREFSEAVDRLALRENGLPSSLRPSNSSSSRLRTETFISTIPQTTRSATVA